MLTSLFHPLPPHPSGTDATAFFLLDVLLIVVLARLLGGLAKRLGQPRAVGEIVAGILLGPTLIGRDLSFFIAPAEVRPSLSALATLALVLFMFLVGLQFESSAIRGREGQATALGLLSVAAPAGVGFLVAASMHDARFAGPAGASALAFGLFIGACLSVTALPVIAHVLLERGELNSRAGGVGLAASAVASVAMFAYIALASTVIDDNGYGGFLLRLSLIAVAGVAARFLARPVLRRLLRRKRVTADVLSADGMAIVFGGLVLSAIVADRLGISALVGGFVWGLLIPADAGLRRRLADRLGDIASVLLLPVFFAFAGLSTDLRLITPRVLPVLGLVLVAAVASKLLAALPARLYGMSWRETGVLGVLMNTRGLVLLVVGLIGLELGVITQATYTIMVVVALATNLMTGPLLNALSASPGRVVMPELVAERAMVPNR